MNTQSKAGRTRKARHSKLVKNLPKTLLFPEAMDFADIFEQFTTDKTKAPAARVHEFQDYEFGKGYHPAKMLIGNYIHTRDNKSGYCRITDAAYEKLLANTLSLPDSISFETIDHENGYTLLVASHSVIIGNSWLAYVRTETVPEF